MDTQVPDNPLSNIKLPTYAQLRAFEQELMRAILGRDPDEVIATVKQLRAGLPAPLPARAYLEAMLDAMIVRRML